MGIPHLITALEPYAELEALAGQEIVIDGPAFAYHIYYICLRTRQDARGSSDAAPPYLQICSTAIEWLKALEENGASIKKIYFDGFLPPSKLNVRLERLISLTRRMSDYYYANQAVYLPTTRRVDCPTSLFEGTSVPTRLTALPPPAFLVPAVLESLNKSSTFKNLTQVVPGEADTFCSLYLHKHGGMVLTGDSDLLVHDLGSKGKVGFLRDVRVVGSGALKCQVFWPTAIANRLSLQSPDGITRLAFEMKTNPQGSFTKLLSRVKNAKGVTDDTAAYVEFQKDYKTVTMQLPQSPTANSPLSILQHADPRISEYLLHYPLITHLAGCEEGLTTLPLIHIFLPFLIDSPTKTSAWEMSSHIRQIAYSLITLVIPPTQQRQSIFEHKKQTDRSNGREMALLSLTALEEACTSLLDQITHLRAHLPPTIPTRDFWLILAIHNDISFAHTNSKPSTAILTHAHLTPKLKPPKTTSWDTIQFHSQTLATYYSLRTLHLISTLVTSMAVHPETFSSPSSSSSDPTTTIPDYLTTLHSHLTTLPTLPNLHDLSELPDMMSVIDKYDVFNVVYDMLGVDRQTTVVADDAKTVKRKRKREQAKAVQRHTKSNNPFALLEAE